MTTVELAERRVPAWRGGFGRLWSAAVVSRFGDALRRAALPLLAVSLTDSPLLIASVTAAAICPGSTSGCWAAPSRTGSTSGARCGRWTRYAGCWSPASRWPSASGTPRSAALALAFALTTLQTLFDNAATALLPAVVAGRPRPGPTPA